MSYIILHGCIVHIVQKVSILRPWQILGLCLQAQESRLAQIYRHKSRTSRNFNLDPHLI